MKNQTSSYVFQAAAVEGFKLTPTPKVPVPFVVRNDEEMVVLLFLVMAEQIAIQRNLRAGQTSGSAHLGGAQMVVKSADNPASPSALSG